MSYGNALAVNRTLQLSLGPCINNGIFGLAKDGTLYVISIRDNAAAQADRPPHMRLAGTVLIDINGYAQPNRLGKDAFVFQAYMDGSLRPVGANDWWAMAANDANEQINWEHGTADVCNEDGVSTGVSCAGSIFENNLKVIYQ